MSTPENLEKTEVQQPEVPQKAALSMNSNFSSFKPSLNLKSGTFVPSTKPNIEFSPQKGEDPNAEKPKLNLNAPIFKPNFAAAADTQPKQKGKKKAQAKKVEESESAEKKTERKKQEPQRKYQVKGTAAAEAAEKTAEAKTKGEGEKDAPKEEPVVKGTKRESKGEKAQKDEKTVTDKKSHKIINRSHQKRDEAHEQGKTQEGASLKAPARKPAKEKKEPAAPKKTVDPLKAYKPPFKAKEKSAVDKQKQDEKTKMEKEEKQKKVYTLEFIFSFKQAHKQRPTNMAELDFPSKKRGANANGFRKRPMTEKDRFNKTLGDIRILLNKLSQSNFETISGKLLKFTYNPSLLYELMKMIFIKSTGEHAYLDVYVKLCTMLFKEFNDKENYEMNFKKLLVSKCQKQFFKMLNTEREERKKRRDSQSALPGAEAADDDGEFSKPMMYLFDEKELQARKKEQMYGNMYLLTELFIARQLNGNIIKTCLDDLQQEMNDQNMEILCYMSTKLMHDLCRQAKLDAKHATPAQHHKYQKKATKVVNLDYADKVCQRLFAQRQNEELQSRTRFKIQDVIDAYNKEWRYVIAESKNRASDSEGFRQIYVPKDQILSEEQVFSHGKRDEKARAAKGQEGPAGYFYRAKSPAPATAAARSQEQEEAGAAKQDGTGERSSKMAGLLSCLKAEDGEKEYDKYIGAAGDSEEDEDEDVTRVVGRRMSLNQHNEVGMNFQKYQDIKPAAGVRREILNMFNEYKELEQKEHAKEELLAICQQYEIERYQFVGYFLSNALAEKPDDFRRYLTLVLEYFFKESDLLPKAQLLESINVCVANLPDLVIDYPNAAKYAGEIFEKAVEFDIMTKEEEEKYNDHIKKMEEYDE